MSSDRIHRILRRLFVGNEHRLARREQLRAHRSRATAQRQIERALVDKGQERRVFLGRLRCLDDQDRWASLPVEEAAGRHWWVTAATRSGKSRAVLALIYQIIRLRAAIPVVADWKGETAQAFNDVIMPALGAEPGGEELLQHMRTINPFDPTVDLPLRLTAPQVGLPPELQAMALTDAIADALDEPLAGGIATISQQMCKLAVELNEPLTRLSTWVAQPDVFIRAGLRSRDPGLQVYVRSVFPREHKASLVALQARLNRLFLLPSLRRSLEAPTCLDFAEILQRGATSLNLGEAPAGAQSAARLTSGLLLGTLSRAIMTRPVSPDSLPVMLILDEAQDALQRLGTEHLQRLLTQAAFKKVFVVFVNQQPGQLSRPLVRTLRTNTAIELIGRCSSEDAQAVSAGVEIVSSTGMPISRRLDVVRLLTGLQPRHFLLWVKDRGLPATIIRTSRFDLEPLLEQAARLPAHLRQRPDQTTSLASADPALPEPETALQLPPRLDEPLPDELSEFPLLG